MGDGARWEVKYHRALKKELRRLPKSAIRRIFSALEGLQIDPRPGTAQKVEGHNLWRLRVGNYRILYQIDEDNQTINTFRISHRRDVYRNL